MGKKQKGTSEVFRDKDLSRACQLIFSKTDLAQHQGSQHPTCKQERPAPCQASARLRSISDCSQEEGEAKTERWTNTCHKSHSHMPGHLPRRKQNKMRGGPRRATTISQTAVGMDKSALTNTDHTVVCEIPHLAFSLDTGEHAWEAACGKSWQVRTMFYQG